MSVGPIVVGVGLAMLTLATAGSNYWVYVLPAVLVFGLGLAITRHIVELHGGEIRVESDSARGTTFTFELPLATAGAVNSAAGSAVR